MALASHAEPNSLRAQARSCDCPDGYISIQGDRDYGTSSFCVMKYEASEQEGLPQSQVAAKPWVNISGIEAADACQRLGEGYHLLTNEEWMTIGSRAAAHPRNWTGGARGVGTLMRGHAVAPPEEACPASEDDRRAWVAADCMTLTQGEIEPDREGLRRTLILGQNRIWDMSGNVWEWVAYDRGNLDKPTPDDNDWHEYTDITTTPTFPLHDFIPEGKASWDRSWNNAKGIGVFSGGSNSTGGALIRGGGWYFGQNTGLFSASLKYESSLQNPNLGFRCAYVKPSTRHTR